MPTIPKPEIFHPLTAPDRAVMAALRTQLEPLKGQLQGTGVRPQFDDLMTHTPAAAGVTYEAATVGGVAGWWCRPAAPGDPARAVLYLHGGAYNLGSALAFRHFVGQLAARTGVECFAPEYRLAPEHPFPAAVDDAQAAYQGLVGLGKRRIGVAGDSAGGGLALILLTLTTHGAASQPGAVAPCAAVAFSPWTDLTLTSASMTTRAEADFLLTRQNLAEYAAAYLGGHQGQEARASPVYGELRGLPPLQLHVGDAEILRDDAVRYAERAQAAGVAAEVHVWEGMTHVFPASLDTLEAARQALDLAGTFLANQLR